jgi:hypothetical protein
VIRQAAVAGYLGLSLEKTDADPNDSVQEAVWKVFKDGQEIDTTVEINFPPILRA